MLTLQFHPVALRWNEEFLALRVTKFRQFSLSDYKKNLVV